MTIASSGIPGLRRLDHVGMTVPDIDSATRFLVDVIGCEYLYSLAPIEREDDWMRDHLNVPAGSAVRHLRFFRCGDSPVFEVFEYESPEAASEPPRNSDVGGHHFALYVEDLDAAVDYLRSAGVEVLGDPTASKGAHEGQRWVYFLAPWGAQFELVSYPRGRAWYLQEAEATHGARVEEQHLKHRDLGSEKNIGSSNEGKA